LCEKAHLACCQVNSLQRIFMESEQPELLHQDIGFAGLSNWLDPAKTERECGRSARTLDEWLGVIDWYFETYGPQAVAAKNQGAYGRRLNYDEAARGVAESAFAKIARGENPAADE